MKKIIIFMTALMLSFSLQAKITPEDINIKYEEVENTDKGFRYNNSEEKNIEVLYFFSYSCPSCYNFKPYLEQWKKIKKENIHFQPIAVNFRESWEETSKAYYINQSLNIKDFDKNIYKYIHENNNKIFFKEDLKKFFVTKLNINSKKFDSIYNSFSLKIKTNKATKVTDGLEIMGTPTFVLINKKGEAYKTSIGMTGDPLSTIVTLEYLIRKSSQ